MRETPLEILTYAERISNFLVPESSKVLALYYIIKEACYKGTLDEALQEASEQYDHLKCLEARIKAGGNV
ncbi:MAG: hypothetical protein FWF63_00690 [Fibromonadales bacterium]|nr:hypothetical protein [Fibromonadales bacterium]